MDIICLMVEGGGRSFELRQQFEKRYRKLLPDFRRVFLHPQEFSRNGPWRKAYESWLEEGVKPKEPALLKDFKACRKWCDCQKRVWGLMESDNRRFSIAYRLVVPISRQLDIEAAREVNLPPKPATRKQTLRAIETLDNKINSEMLGLMYEGVRPESEDWGDLSVNQRRIDYLVRSKKELEARLLTFQNRSRRQDL